MWTATLGRLTETAAIEVEFSLPSGDEVMKRNRCINDKPAVAVSGGYSPVAISGEYNLYFFRLSWVDVRLSGFLLLEAVTASAVRDEA